MKRIMSFNILSIFSAITFFSCSSENGKPINYLDQKPPGKTAEIFAPGLISTDSVEHSSPVFSPDGMVVLWNVVYRTKGAFILEMKNENGVWSKPKLPSFADSTAAEFYPSFSSDGKKLFFTSNRKQNSNSQDVGLRIWQTERTENGWAIPIPFDTTVSRGQDYSHSISKNGTLFFSSALSGETGWSIRQSEIDNDKYVQPTTLPYSINSMSYEDGPLIAPDESFLIFESQRPDGIEGSIDLYITFKDNNGDWSPPLNMGPHVNTSSTERFARLSPDGKYLFFGSNRSEATDNLNFDIYWIDASIIEELRKNAPKESIDSLGARILSALDNRQWDAGSELLNQWLTIHPNDLDAAVNYSACLRKTGKYPEAEKALLSKAAMMSSSPGFLIENALVLYAVKKNDEAAELLTPILGDGKQQRDRLINLASSLFEMKAYTESAEYFERVIAINPRRADYYDLARCYALINNRDKAFKALSKSLETGYGEKQQLEDEKDFQSLQSDARWKELLKQLE